MTSDVRATDDQMPGINWRTSSYSGKQGNCVQVGALSGVMAVRDSHDPHGPALICPRDELAHFLAAVKGGAFDGRHH